MFSKTTHYVLFSFKDCLILYPTNMNLKIDGWNTSTLLGSPIFGGELLVSGSVKSPYPINSSNWHINSGAASSATGSNTTATLEVCIRPLRSVTGIRCTRWTPDSWRNQPKGASWQVGVVNLPYLPYPPVPNVRHRLPRKKTPAFFKRAY